jgi:hypothetical protein
LEYCCRVRLQSHFYVNVSIPMFQTDEEKTTAGADEALELALKSVQVS